MKRGKRIAGNLGQTSFPAILPADLNCTVAGNLGQTSFSAILPVNLSYTVAGKGTKGGPSAIFR